MAFYNGTNSFHIAVSQRVITGGRETGKDSRRFCGRRSLRSGGSGGNLSGKGCVPSNWCEC